jgi:putative transcriptional regulator
MTGLVWDSGAADTANMNETTDSLKNQFLVAMPGLQDENFNHTVSLLCEHSDSGAVGLVINRPTDLRLSEMMEQMGLDHDEVDGETIVYWGGPVQPERGFVIHREPGGWESCLPLDAGLFITTSRDILSAIGKGEGPREFFVVLGYAGWDAGQLETEMLHNAWLNTPLDGQILFRIPAGERWQAATRLLGVDVSQITSEAGHA